MSRLPVALAALLGLALLVAGPGPASAQATRSVSWERFDVAIELLPDSTLRIVQTETIRFDGTFQRAFREIPLDRVSSITEVQVGEGGQPYRAGYNQPGTFAVTRSDNALRIDWWFPPTTNATRTFELSYRVSGAIRVYAGGDQLYWVAVPADRPGQVEASDVGVRLPEAVPDDQLKSEAYLGGHPARSQPSVAGREVHFAAQDLPPGQDFQVRVQFPRGLVAATAPSWQAAYDRQAWYDSAVRPILNLLLLVLALLVLVGGLLGLVLRWYTAGRDPAAGPEPAELDAPPDGLPPGLVGTVVDERADLQDVLATLIDLGNRGVIRITQERDPALQGSDLDYRLELLQPQPLGLRSYEKTVIGALFGSAREVRLSQVKDRWAANIPLFESQLYAEAARQGLFAENPEQVRQRWHRGALATIVGAAVLGFLAQAALGGAANLVWLPFLALVVVGLAALFAARRMPRRTKAGVVEAARWRAFARHLAAARKRSDEARPDEITRYLPYAVALGVDRSWLENFAAIGSPAPRWQVGNGPIIIGPGGWGFPGYYGPGPFGGPWSGAGWGAPGPARRGAGGEQGSGPGGLAGASGGLSGGLDSASGSLSDLLNAASDALSSGGDSGWSGGGGDFGGDGGSGGGSAGFD